MQFLKSYSFTNLHIRLNLTLCSHFLVLADTFCSTALILVHCRQPLTSLVYFGGLIKVVSVPGSACGMVFGSQQYLCYFMSILLNTLLFHKCFTFNRLCDGNFIVSQISSCSIKVSPLTNLSFF